MKYSKKLSLKNYLQITLLMTALGWLLLPLMGPKVLFAVAIIWPLAEMVNKLLYRKEIPCPYCGFDATWYRRDVKVARQKVEAYWNKNYPHLVNKKEEMLEAVTKSEAPISAQSVNSDTTAPEAIQ